METDQQSEISNSTKLSLSVTIETTVDNNPQPPVSSAPPTDIAPSAPAESTSPLPPTVSLVPAPSLTRTSSSSRNSLTLTPVYIVPPEVEQVDVRAGWSPSVARKNRSSNMQQLRNTVGSSLGSLTGLDFSGEYRHSTGMLNAGSSSSVAQDTDGSYILLRAITKMRGQLGLDF